MRQYIVDAFTDTVFHGNPAAVRVVQDWPSDETMQAIATENALSETAFARPAGGDGGYELRWFTPGGEIDLCGHATLATAFVLFRYAVPDADEVTFSTMGGTLAVRRDGDLLEMSFPAYRLEPVAVTDAMAEAFGERPMKASAGRDLLCVFPDAKSWARASSPPTRRRRAAAPCAAAARATGSSPAPPCCTPSRRRPSSGRRAP